MARKRVKPKECSLKFHGSKKFKKSFSGCGQRSEFEFETHLLLPCLDLISNLKNYVKKISPNWPKSPKFGTNHVFAATWPMESFNHTAEIKGHSIFDGVMMPNQPRRQTVAMKIRCRCNKSWWDLQCIKTFWCLLFFLSLALMKIVDIWRLE